MLRPRLALAFLPVALTLFACDKPEAEQPTREEVRAMCEVQTTPEDCAAVPTQDYNEIGESAWCAWVVEIPVALEGDVCSFGEPTAGCQLVSAGDPGCYAPTDSTCGPASDYQWSRSEAGMTVLGYADNLCSPNGNACTVTPEGVVEGGPECACLCEPGLPSE